MIAAELRPRVSAAVKASAESIAETARANVHVSEGDGPHLRDAIHVERVGAAEYAVVAGDEDIFWAHFEEFGTSHSPAHPFLIPAAEAGRDEAARLVTAALKTL